MKKHLLYILFAGITSAPAFAQEVSFKALDEKTNHLIGIQAGADYSTYYGLSYGYILKNKYTPIVIGTEFTVPFGGNVLDDWKWKTGVQAQLWKNGRFSLAVKPTCIVRRYESVLARMYNIGADVSLNFGYTRPKWGIVALAAYDASFSTHIRHGILREYYPQIRDGWYGTAGGNFKFGARVNGTFGAWNAFLTLGKHYGQNFKDNPTLPFFAEVSLQRQLGK
jgi:hypothetical protein